MFGIATSFFTAPIGLDGLFPDDYFERTGCFGIVNDDVLSGVNCPVVEREARKNQQLSTREFT